MMKKNNQIKLPSLDDYQDNFRQQGIIIPLQKVPFSETGLLAKLPPPPSGKTGWPWTVESQLPPTTMPNGYPWPRISIVTPSYNQGAFIEETIRSVLLQNYPNLEYIICDGDSTDETKEILEKYSPWLSFWQSKKDRGQGHAINLGFSLASGDYFGWINSDDFYMPKCFHNVAVNFSRYKPNFVYGDSLIIHDNDRKIRCWQGRIVIDRYLQFCGLIASHTAFWQNIIHVPILEIINCAIDYELWLRLLPKNKKHHVKLPLAVSRFQSQSKSAHKRYRTAWDEDRKIIESIYAISPHSSRILNLEFQLIQSIYRRLNRSESKCNIEAVLQRNNLTWVVPKYP